MTTAPNQPHKRGVRTYLLVTAACMALLLGVLGWYMTTDSFQTRVRRRVVAELEAITGGRVELEEFHTVPLKLRVEARNLTIHGREGPSDIPYAHVNDLVARVKIVSVLGAEVGFHSLVLERPVVHLIVYPDGSTNQPQPKRASGSASVESLLALSIGTLDVRNGELLWDNQHIPLSFVANDVAGEMYYSYFGRHYSGHLVLGKVDTHLQSLRPFAWRADTRFTLSRSFLQVDALNWSSGQSSLHLSGTINSFQHPALQGSYKLKVALVEAAAITRTPGLGAGQLELEGRGTWSADEFGSEGKLALRMLDLRKDPIRLRDVEATSDFWISSRQLRLTKLQGRMFGGSLAGDVEISNWLQAMVAPRSRANAGKAREHGENPQAETAGLFRVRLRDAYMPAVFRSLSPGGLSLAGVNLTGSADVSVNGAWKESLRDLDANVALTITPPRAIPPGQVGLMARGNAVYRVATDTLEVSQFVANTPASQFSAAGKLASDSSLRVAAATTNLAELQPTLAALGGAANLPVLLHGRAAFNGQLNGRLSSPSLQGQFQVMDFDTLVPAAAHRPAHAVRWDSLVASLSLSSNRMSVSKAVLQRGKSAIHAEMEAHLSQWRLTSRDTFTAGLSASKVPVAEFQTLAGYNYPITGLAELTLHASGTTAAPHVQGQLEVREATIHGQPVSRIAAMVAYSDHEFQLNDLVAQQNGSRVAGSAAYNPSDESFRFAATGDGFDLSRIPQLQSRQFATAGGVAFTAKGSGTVDSPVINARFEVRDLTFDRERAGDFMVTAVTRGSDLHLTGRSSFKESELSLDGAIRMRDQWPADLKAQFNHLDVDSLIRVYFGGRLTGHSAMAGEVRLRGPLRKPGELDIAANLTSFLVDIANIKVANSGPVRFTLKDQRLSLYQMHLVGDLTDFTAEGTAELAANRSLNFGADGHLNLKLIETINPDFSSAGTVSMNLRVAGTMADPALQGEVLVSDGSLSYRDLPSGLSAMNGRLSFNKDRLQIQTLTARTGGGTVDMKGSISYYAGQVNFALTAHGEDVRMRYPPGVSSTGNADLQFVGSTSASLLSGELMITRLALTPGFDFASYLERSRQSASVPSSSSLLNNIRLDIHVNTAPDLEMQTALAKLSGDADLRLRGTVTRPAVLGRVNILEGEINFNGAKYRLERGDVTFTNPVKIEPVLDLVASTRVGEYDITLGINGPVDKLSLNYRSEPPLPSADVIALLAVGRTREESAALQSSSSTSAASDLILSQALNSVISNRAQRLFGVSRIKIDPQGLGTETSTTNRGPLVTIEQQVYNNLNLTYSTTVSQTSQQIIQLEYALSRNVSIVALRDYNGVVSFDVRIRKRRK